MAGQIADLSEANEVLVAKVARLEHLLSRNSKNSSSPPSRDEDPGRTPPEDTRRRSGRPRRSKDKQPEACGSESGLNRVILSCVAFLVAAILTIVGTAGMPGS
jgi:Family of unknown function (DUF6444)